MKHLGKEATKVMNILTDRARDGYARIDNGSPGFMPVVVERLRETDYGTIYSVTHYYEQNGDLMCDPDVEFLKIVGQDTYYFPLTFRQDNLGIYRQLVDIYSVNGKTVRLCDHRRQADLVTFCNQWMRNIKAQQGI